MTDTAQAARNRPELSPFVLNVLVATYLMALCNSTFWGHLFRIFEGRTVTALVFSGAVWALVLFVVSLLAVRRLQKPVLVALLITAGVTSYYVDVLGVVVDRDMIQNAMTTTFAESKHLITLHFITHAIDPAAALHGFRHFAAQRRNAFSTLAFAISLVHNVHRTLLRGFCLFSQRRRVTRSNRFGEFCRLLTSNLAKYTEFGQ